METLEIITADKEFIKTELKKFNKSDAAIALLRDEFMVLTITSTEDKAGYKKVYEARQVIKNHRVDVEKKRKELKKSVLEVGAAIDGEAKRLTAQLEPIELHLETIEVAHERELEAIRVAEQNKETLRIQARIDALAKYGFAIDLKEVQSISDETFGIVLNQAKEQFEVTKIENEKRAQEKRLADIQKVNESVAEAQKLRTLKLEQEAEALRLKTINDKLLADQKALQDEKDKFAAQVAENNRIEIAKEEAKRNAEYLAKLAEELDAKNKAQAIINAEQKALLAPDKEKLTEFLSILRSIRYPELTTEQGLMIRDEFKLALRNAAITLKEQIEKL